MNFDTNSYPDGWKPYFVQGTLGGNLKVANGRLEIGQVDTYGGIYKQFDLTNVSQVKVEYDGNIANLFWGQGTAASLMSTITTKPGSNGVFPGNASHVQAGGGKTGFGQNTIHFDVGFVPTTNASPQVVGSGPKPADYGTYHYTAIFNNGSASLTATSLTGGTNYSSGTVSFPGLQLSSLPYIGLWGLATTGASAWIDNVAITLTPGSTASAPPTTAALAKLASDVYGQSTLDTGNFILVSTRSNTNGFKANVYLDSSTNQVVIAVRGTYTNGSEKEAFYNILADGALQPNGLAAGKLIDYGHQLADLIADTQAQILTGNGLPTGATITLTGHSLGGALAEMTGKALKIPSTGFDSPGSLATYNSVFKPALANEFQLISQLGIKTIGELEPHMVRLQGDQVSFVGYKDATNTDQLGKVTTVMTSLTKAEQATSESDIRNYHSIEILSAALNSSSPLPVQDGYSNELNILGRIVKGTADTCTKALTMAVCFYIKGKAGIKEYLMDPGPGNDYFLLSDPGSPFIDFIELPLLDGISGWKLRYLDENGWSEFEAKMGISDFDFSTNVTGVEFIPLNSGGAQGYNYNFFTYNLRLTSSDDFRATQLELGTIPTPGTLALGVAALACMGLGRRRASGRRDLCRLH